MTRYILRRGVHSVVIVIVLVAAVFLILGSVGDPALTMASSDLEPEQIQQIRERLGTDRPLIERFANYMVRVAQGDFGESYWQRRPALEVVLERVPATLLLAGVTISVTLILAIPLGLYCAARPGSPVDRAVGMISFAGLSIPDFWLGLMAILVFAVWLGILPVSGSGTALAIVLPTLTLMARPFGRLTQLLRSSLLEEYDKQYVETARAKGLDRRTVATRHVFRNAFVPTLVMSGDELASLLNGAVIVETVFGWPGIGFLSVQSIRHLDTPVVVATVVVIRIMVVLVNFAVDMLQAYFDSRIKYA